MKLEKIIKLNEKYNLIEENDKIIVGFSGGPDSVFLVEILKKLRKRIKFDIFLVHINHSLRGENSDGDETFSKNYAFENNFQIYSKKINIEKLALERKKTLEEVGREERYNFFQEILRKVAANKIATAHNKDDQIETFLFRMMRGTSLQGLEGIKIKNLNIIRPISEIYKKDILNYLNKNEIQYRIDETNFENKFTRNSIRLDLIPFIEERYNLKFKDKIFSLIKEIRENNKVNEIKLAEYIKNKKISLEMLNKETSFIKGKIITNYINKYNIDISRVKIEKIKELLNKSGMKKLDLSKEFRIVKDYKFLYLESNKEEKFLEELELNIPSKIKFGNYEIFIQKFEISKNKEINNNNNYLLEIPKKTVLKVRTRKKGDKIKLFSNAGTKKVKKILIDKKIPKDQRDKIPIFTADEEIFWIGGVKKGQLIFKKNLKENLEKILFSIQEVKVGR